MNLGLAVHKMLELRKRHGYWTYDPNVVSHSSYKFIRHDAEQHWWFHRNAYLEHTFNLPVWEGLPTIKGVIDMWAHGTNRLKNLYILDYKTTSDARYLIKQEDLKTNWQLVLYAHVLATGAFNVYKSTGVDIAQYQLVKDRKGNISKSEYIEHHLTEKERLGIIDEIRLEAEATKITTELYNEKGLKAIRATPENKRWYGRIDPFWPVIHGEVSLKSFKEHYL
jgi:RecB family exonuclease